ncbi:hypothetical protein MXMO3_03478 (plasmid) [Maritalea myrionectae]|uniref:Uncharacterized protein n=1 Tax=Maritalea myrionectae TaxID=454601 RepID=A0A2R4MJ02_9HYPH|nr:hypothetical protein MXMO3_03478 [Maritalea myrionectae]
MYYCLLARKVFPLRGNAIQEERIFKMKKVKVKTSKKAEARRCEPGP